MNLSLDPETEIVNMGVKLFANILRENAAKDSCDPCAVS